MRGRSPFLHASVAVALLASGCGGDDERPARGTVPPGDYGPATAQPGTAPRPVAPPSRPPSAAVARALAAGDVGVVGVEGEVGVRPRRLDVSSDGSLQQLRWTAWGHDSAEARGRLRLLDCDPSCAAGGVDFVEARIRLSQPRTCGRGRYFDRAEITVAGGRPPAAYVRAPC